MTVRLKVIVSTKAPPRPTILLRMVSEKVGYRQETSDTQPGEGTVHQPPPSTEVSCRRPTYYEAVADEDPLSATGHSSTHLRLNTIHIYIGYFISTNHDA